MTLVASSAAEGSGGVSVILIFAIVVALAWWAIRLLTKDHVPRPPTDEPRQPSRRVTQNLSHLPEQKVQVGADRIQESEYLHSSKWDELLKLRGGLPPLHLVNRDGELWLREDSTGLLVNVANRKLWRMGIWTVAVRGVDYHKKAVRAAELSPGSSVELIREPAKNHDPNAVAICAANSPEVIGYFNKGMAPRLSKLLATGAELSGISLAGEPAGTFTDSRIRVLAAPPNILAHLVRRLPIDC